MEILLSAVLYKAVELLKIEGKDLNFLKGAKGCLYKFQKPAIRSLKKIDILKCERCS